MNVGSAGHIVGMKKKRAPVRLHTHWSDAVRVEADRSTLERAASALTAAGYLIAPPPHGTNPGRRSGRPSRAAALSAHEIAAAVVVGIGVGSSVAVTDGGGRGAASRWMGGRPHT